MTIHPGEKAIPIGDLVSEKVGMVAVTVRTCVGDVKLNRVLNFEYYDETAMPDSGIGTTAERKQAAIRFMAENGLDNLAKALALRIMGGQEALVKRIWEKELSCIRQREDCADFRLPALFHAYHSPLFTGEEKESINRYCWISGTGRTNRAMMSCGFQLKPRRFCSIPRNTLREGCLSRKFLQTAE